MTADDRAWMDRVDVVLRPFWRYVQPAGPGSIRVPALYVWAWAMRVHRFAWRLGVRL